MQCRRMEKTLLCERVQRFFNMRRQAWPQTSIIPSQGSVLSAGGISYVSLHSLSVSPFSQQDQPVKPYRAKAQKNTCPLLLLGAQAPLTPAVW